MMNPIKLPISQKIDKNIGISFDGKNSYSFVSHDTFTSFHNSQLKFKFRYTFLVFYFSYFSSDFYFFLMGFLLLVTITYLGALILPIKAKTKDITQHKKYTYKLSPHYSIDG